MKRARDVLGSEANPIQPAPGHTASSYPAQARSSTTTILASSSAGIILAALSLVVSLIWVLVVPPLAGPDETAHLMAVMEVRTLGRLPEIHYDFTTDPRGVPVPPYGNAAVAAYAQGLGLPSGTYSVPYESMQPPLFYVAAALFSLPFSPAPQTVLLVSKLLAALLGAATVYFIWAAVRQLAPSAPLLATSCALCVALLPLFAYTSSSANNDSALYTICAALFYVWFRGLRDPKYDPYLIRAGLLMGLGLLAKLTIIAMMPAFAMVILFHALDASPTWAARLRRAALLGLTSTGASLVVAAWWLVRNIVEYGDITGSAAAIKWYSSHYTHGDLSSLPKITEFFSDTFVSFIGLFNWDATLLPSSVNHISEAIILLLAFLSCVTLILRPGRRSAVDPFTRRSISILALASLGVFASYVQYSLAVSYQPQARYLFALLLPISLGLMTGLYALSRNVGAKLAFALLWAPPCLLILLNYVALSVLSHVNS